jgi:hypothetical protein
MSQSVPIQLQTAAIFEQNNTDRPTFQARIARGLSGPRGFHLFGFPESMLFLEGLEPPKQMNKGTQAAVIGGVLGGAVGGLIGGLIVQSMSQDAPHQPPEMLNLRSDAELVYLAKIRKRSFVSEYKDVKWARIDAPSSFSKMFLNEELAGTITYRDRTIGTLVLELPKPNDMMVAITLLQKRLGDRVKVNAKWNPTKLVYTR